MIGIIIDHRNVSNPMVKPKVIIAVKLIIGSVTSTVPTAFRGSEPPKMNMGVHRGPQPPPPLTSMKAPTKPRRGTNFFGSFLFIMIRFLANRKRIIIPIPSKMKLTNGFAVFKLIQERKIAPRTAPKMPGITNRQKRPFSRFPSFQ